MNAKPDFLNGADHALDFIPDDTECGRVVRSIDWSATPLGGPQRWSPALRMMVPFVLANRFPQLLWWGPEYTCVYNDAYAPVLGSKHPWAMGRPTHEVWAEVWEVLRPLIDTPFNGGPATWIEDFDLEVQRHGFIEESHFTVAYSPVPDESAPRGIGGVLATVHEITQKVIGERRVGILRDLGARVADTRSDFEACNSAANILAQYPKDLPFALIYLLDEDRQRLRLVSRTGIDPQQAGPTQIDLDNYDAVRWPLVEALRTETTQVARGIDGLPSISFGAATHVPDTVAVVPIKSNIAHKPAGALVVGISPRIRLDALYSSFIELVGSQIATAVANARAYEEERRRAAALAEIDRAKTAFFSNVSHEFRTPLTLMLGPLQDALHGDLPEPLRGQLDLAHRNSLRLLKLVNSLLDFARIEAGRVTASFEPVDLAALTEDLASNFRSAIERAGLRFDVQCTALPASVHVDREMWEKIVLNLLSNAFKFTHSGSVALTLKQDGRHALLEVTDTGIGIEAAELPRLFERFHRVEGAQGRTHEGSGIGLALVHELVKLHGGSIDASSEPGRGTTFRVRIPCGIEHLPIAQRRTRGGSGIPSNYSTAVGSQAFVQEALRWLPDAQATTGSIEGAAPRSTDLRFAATFGARVVLADDNADMRGYVRDLLGPHYQIEAVADGVAALEAARRSRPDLLISDVMMPRLDGLGLLRALRADPGLREVPLILLSARAGEEARIEGLNAGADDYVVKPFSARELLARVGALLELTHARRASEVQQRRELETASRQKDEFLAMLAHELRNPLAPIRNAGEILSRNLPADIPMRTAVHTIERQVTHLTRLVDDLLDVSRITQGRIELRRRTVAVADIVARALETVDPLIRRKRHKVSIAASRWDLHVNVDPERMVQCLANVLTNAAKYTEPGGEIHVDTRDENGEAIVTISDNGIGIAPELLPRVFELFVQGERTLDRSQGGLGIGLAIVKRLIEMHDGSVSIDSGGERRGTRIEIRLQLFNGVADATPAPALHTGNARRILVVDDNEDAANTLAMLLKMEGHEAEASYSGLEALDRIDRCQPAVVLLDIGLPGLDGYQVAERIRTRYPKSGIQLIAITGYGQDNDRQRTRSAGFAHHLVKPVDFADLRRVLTPGS